MFDFSNYVAKSKYQNDSNKLIIGKMKDETGDIVIKTFVGLKPKVYSYLIDNNDHQKKQMTIKMLQRWVIMNKVSLSCFDDKIYIKAMDIKQYVL